MKGNTSQIDLLKHACMHNIHIWYVCTKAVTVMLVRLFRVVAMQLLRCARWLMWCSEWWIYSMGAYWSESKEPLPQSLLYSGLYIWLRSMFLQTHHKHSQSSRSKLRATVATETLVSPSIASNITFLTYTQSSVMWSIFLFHSPGFCFPMTYDVASTQRSSPEAILHQCNCSYLIRL